MDESIVKNSTVTIIKPASGWQIIDINELKEYKDLSFLWSGEK